MLLEEEFWLGSNGEVVPSKAKMPEQFLARGRVCEVISWEGRREGKGREGKEDRQAGEA